jgi:hypothetical protein
MRAKQADVFVANRTVLCVDNSKTVYLLVSEEE